MPRADDEAPKSKLRVSFDDNIKSTHAGTSKQKMKTAAKKPSGPCGLELLLRASEVRLLLFTCFIHCTFGAVCHKA